MPRQWCSHVIPAPWVWVGSVICSSETENREKKWCNIAVMVTLCKIAMSISLIDCLPCWLQWSKWPSWRSPHGKEVMAAFSQQLATKWRLTGSHRHHGTEFWQKKNYEPGSRFFLNHLEGRLKSKTIPWSVSLQRTQLSCAETPDPQKLWDDECVLF